MRRLLQFAVLFLLVATSASAAITHVTGADCNGTSSANSCATSGALTGDLQLAYAGRDGSTTAPTNASWTSVSTSSINGTGSADSSVNLFCRVLTGNDAATGTFANAGRVNIQTYRGYATATTATCATAALGTPVFTKTSINTTSTTETFASVTNAAATSWDVGFGYAPAATAGLNTAPTGMTNRTLGGVILGGHDTNAAVSSYSTANVTITTASRIITVVVEIKVLPPTDCPTPTIGTGWSCKNTASATSGASTATAQAAPAFSNALTNPSILIVHVGQQTGGGTPVFTFSDGGVNLSFTDAGSGKVLWHGSASEDQVFYALNTTTSASYTLTVNSTLTQAYLGITVTEFTGNAASSPIDAFAASPANSTTTGTGGGNITSTSASPGTNGDLIFGSCNYLAGGVAYGSGYTGVINSSAVIEAQVQASHAAIAATFNDSTGSDAYVAFVLAIKPPGGVTFVPQIGGFLPGP
jgi:trimeric autotransporter adhesin